VLFDSALTHEIGGCAAALMLAGSYPLGRALSRLHESRREALESFIGGTSIAYLVLDLLVELTYRGREPVHAALPLGLEPEQSLFAVVLVGLTVSYVLGALADRLSRHAPYAAYLGWNIAYNAVVGGALVVETEEGLRALALFALAMLLHLTVRQSHAQSTWGSTHRTWPGLALVASAPALGALLWAGLLPKPALAVALALVAGTTLMQVVREELPSPSSAHIGTFLLGVAAYSLLIAARWSR
jgi:hypothetical protein